MTNRHIVETIEEYDDEKLVRKTTTETDEEDDMKYSNYAPIAVNVNGNADPDEVVRRITEEFGKSLGEFATE